MGLDADASVRRDSAMSSERNERRTSSAGDSGAMHERGRPESQSSMRPLVKSVE